MYATKEAVIAKEHASEMEATIFFMDMRAYGKDFDKYIDTGKERLRRPLHPVPRLSPQGDP